MDPDRDYGNTRNRPSQNQTNSTRNSNPNTENSSPVYRGASQNISSPSPAVNPAPSRTGGMNSGSGGSRGYGGSGGGGGPGRSGRSGGGSRF